MTIEIVKCDRCGKEISNNDPLDQKGHKMQFPDRKKKWIRFAKRKDFYETTHVICDECHEEFMKWWNNKNVF